MEQTTNSDKRNVMDSTCYSDCKFLVGADFVDNAEEITGHKVIFAIASPVFKSMFFGGIPEEGEINVPDIHPDAFRTMVDFLYTGVASFVSVEQAIRVWHAADKYDIPELVKYLTKYLVENMTLQNACKILQLSISYRNEILMKKCHEIIKADISVVLNDSSFLEADLSTLNFILDQDELKVSEVDLFRALVRYENAQNDKSDIANSLESPATSPGKFEAAEPEVKKAGLSNKNLSNTCTEGSPHQESTETQEDNKPNGGSSLKELFKKIRFLTMTPEEFGICVEMSSFFSTVEELSIFLNICTSTACKYPMPEGFSTIKEQRKLKADAQRYCIHTPERCFHKPLLISNLDGSLRIQTSATIKITGLQVWNPRKCYDYIWSKEAGDLQITIRGQNIYFDEAFSLKASDDFVDIIFTRPAHIKPVEDVTISFRSQNLKWFSMCEKYASNYTNNYRCMLKYNVNNVTFDFAKLSKWCECKGFIKAIIFTT